MIREGNPGDVAAIGRTMADAFEADPVAGWFWSEPQTRHEHLRSWYELVAQAHYLDHGKVFIAEENGEVAGCVMWSPPGSWRFSLREELRTTKHALPRIGWRRAPVVAVAMRRIERRHPTDPHWYLSELGVRPESQGKGLGSRLMFEVLALCDREGIPAYLESSTERSRALYERHGFEVSELIHMPRGGPPLWLMWRKPKEKDIRAARG